MEHTFVSENDPPLPNMALRRRGSHGKVLKSQVASINEMDAQGLLDHFAPTLAPLTRSCSNVKLNVEHRAEKDKYNWTPILLGISPSIFAALFGDSKPYSDTLVFIFMLTFLYYATSIPSSTSLDTLYSSQSPLRTALLHAMSPILSGVTFQLARQIFTVRLQVVQNFNILFFVIAASFRPVYNLVHIFLNPNQATTHISTDKIQSYQNSNEDHMDVEIQKLLRKLDRIDSNMAREMTALRNAYETLEDRIVRLEIENPSKPHYQPYLLTRAYKYVLGIIRKRLLWFI